MGRILPPDPVEEALEKAIAEGVLDPNVLDGLPSTAEVASTTREPSSPGRRPGSDAIIALREDRSGR
ncbi:MAG: hypothetical protein ACRDQ7_14720 [Haloechinothrix sp.]